MDPHISNDQLHQLNAGELNASSEESVRRHLASCPQCHQRNQELLHAQTQLVANLRAARADSEVPPAADQTTPLPHASPPNQRSLTDPLPQLPGYDMIRELHRGGQGVVYEAFQRATKRKVAVKLMLGGRFASKATQKRFEREIELVAQLKHPNIIAIFDSGTTSDGQSYYVMDYVRGLRLDAYVREKKLSLEETLRLFAVVCEALQYAHQRGVIHRDLKPSNVLVDAQGHPWVLDFGLAKLLAGSSDTVVSLTEQIVGTLPYMSPEQARGNPDEIDVRTDVYSLGVMLYELLTGKYPYPVVGQILDILRNIAETPPTPPSHVWDKSTGVRSGIHGKKRSLHCPIDDEVETIVLKALAKERQRRYQSASELARDIGHYLAGEPLEAKRDSGWYVFKKLVRRQRGRIVTAAVGLALVVSAILYVRAERQACENRADAANREGQQKQNLGLFDEAENLFKEAAAIRPEWRSPWANLCHLGSIRFSATPLNLQDPKWLVEGIACCDRAIALEPEHPRPYAKKCRALLLLGKPMEAERVCRSGLTRGPKDWELQTELAKTLGAQGKWSEARSAADESVKLARGAPLADLFYTYVPWQTLGALQLALDDPGADAAIDRAIKLAYRNAEVYLTSAQRFLAKNEPASFRRALRDAQIADAIKSVDDPRIKRTLALALYRSGDHDSALSEAKAALAIDPTDPVAGYVAAMASNAVNLRWQSTALSTVSA